ncbi:MAG: hypothetical protein RL297_2417 [Pseudomonadota bacterium]|jgi:hypothetical protein
MLRWVLLVLVLANTVFFSWSQGFWAAQGWAPARTNEPERLQQEVQAQAIRLLNSSKDPAEPLPAGPTPTDTTTPSEPASCWWVPGLNPNQANTVRQAMETLSLPASAWSLIENRSNGRWIVYWGKFEQAEVMAQRKATLRQLKIDYREVTQTRWAPGLALGTFSSEAAAKEALSNVQGRGVRSARVVQERPESITWALRLPAVTETEREMVLGVADTWADKTLLACP